MLKINNSDFIKLFENKTTISKLGKIDMEVIEDDSYESLYYKFPLVERLVLEIYKCVPGTNIEMYEQGTMKTINSIINNNSSFDLLPEDLLCKINKYFNENDNSPRNKLFHTLGEEYFEVIVDFNEVNYIIAQLLALLTHISNEFTLSTLKKIDKIE